MSLGPRDRTALFVVICLVTISDSIPHIAAQRSGFGGGFGGFGGWKRSSYEPTLRETLLIAGPVFVFVYICIHMIFKRQKQRREMENQIYLDEPLINTPITDVDPTWRPHDGIWHGQYHGTSHLNYGNHAMNVSLTFHDGRIKSQHDGNDNVGPFQVTGQYRIDNHRVVMTKTYTHEWNEVQYHGTFTTANHMSGIWKLSNGDHGTWELRTDAPTTTSIITEPTTPASYAINIQKRVQSVHVQAVPISNYHPEPSATASASASASVPVSSFEIEGHTKAGVKYM